MEPNTVKLDKVMQNTPHITDEQAHEITLALASTVEHTIDAAFDKRTASLQQSIDQGQENLDAHQRETRDSFAEVRESLIKNEKSIADLKTVVEKNAVKNENSIARLESMIEKNAVKNEKSIVRLESMIEKNAIENSKDIVRLESMIEKNANQNRKDIYDFQYKIVEMIANQNRMMMMIGGIIIAIVLADITFK